MYDMIWYDMVHYRIRIIGIMSLILFHLMSKAKRERDRGEKELEASCHGERNTVKRFCPPVAADWCSQGSACKTVSLVPNCFSLFAPVGLLKIT